LQVNASHGFWLVGFSMNQQHSDA